MSASAFPGPAHRRRAATLLVACGITVEQLRGFAAKAGNPYAARDAEVAEEVESLTGRGLTQRHAVRARETSR